MNDLAPMPKRSNTMPLASWVSFLSALLLSFRVLSAGYAKLTSQINDEVHEKYLADDRHTTSSHSHLSLSPANFREIRGIVDIICGILLLLPSWKRLGAAMAFFLLSVGLVSRAREGQSVAPPLVMMTHCALVWFL